MKNKKAEITNFLGKKVMNKTNLSKRFDPKDRTFPRKVKSKSESLLLKNKKADILHENVIFIILNVVFFSMMLVFIYLQGSSVHLAEEETAKQISLLIDASRPNTVLEINLEKLFLEAEKEGINRENVVNIDETKNLVIVRASENSFYEYSYFNDVYVLDKIEGDSLVLEVLEKND